MNPTKKDRLKKRGWNVGDAADFLQLTEDEIEFIELKLNLAESIRSLREVKGLTQADLARAVGSSQSRVAKMEAADASVTMDLMVRALLKIGARRTDIARTLSSP